MRRTILIFLLAALLCAPLAGRADAMGALFDAIDELGGKNAQFSVVGGLLCATAQKDGETYGFVFDGATGERLTWDDLFTDGDAAAGALEQNAAGWIYDNAYGDFENIAPMPRENFALDEAGLTVYYPAAQLRNLSGAQFGLQFDAYELEGLLREDIALARGDTAQAETALETALRSAALPGLPAEAAPGGGMARAAEALGLVDVPDGKRDAAVWAFEAPVMRGVELLSAPEDTDERNAVITGVFARRIDFSGLIAGETTKDECLAALREPDETRAVAAADAYDRLPAGETLLWRGEAALLEMHFVENILYSVAIFGQ